MMIYFVKYFIVAMRKTLGGVIVLIFKLIISDL